MGKGQLVLQFTENGFDAVITCVNYIGRSDPGNL